MSQSGMSGLWYRIDNHVVNPQNLHELPAQKYTARSSTELQLPSLCCRLQAVVKNKRFSLALSLLCLFGVVTSCATRLRAA